MSTRCPPKKRKIDDDSVSVAESSAPRKKSPLAGLPQNYYAPPKVSMSREELAAWRKEQRRERNRQSAADSRNKTKQKITELEAEVSEYKSLCEAMQKKMAQMEKQIQLLTAAAEQNIAQRCGAISPGTEPEVPSLHKSQHLTLFPPLLSTPADCVPPLQVPSQPDMHNITDVSLDVPSSLKSEEHLKPISRQAVKTGAISLDEDGTDEVETIDTSHIDLVVRNSDSKRQNVEGKIEDDGASQIVTSAEESSIGVVSTDESDEDLLDLLVDTLDCEFDPNLLV